MDHFIVCVIEPKTNIGFKSKFRSLLPGTLNQ